MLHDRPDFDQIVDRSRDGYFRDLFASGLVFANPGFAALAGRSTRQLLEGTASLGDLVHPEGRHELTALIDQMCHAEAEATRAVVQLQRPDRSQVWVELFLVPVPDDESVIGVDGLARDVSEHLSVADLLSRRSHEPSVLLQAQRNLLRTLNFDETVDSIVEQARELLTARAVSLFLVEPGSKQLRPAAAVGEFNSGPPPAALHVDQGTFGSLVTREEPLRVDRLSADERFKAGTTWLMEDGSLLSAPLELGEQVVGALVVIGEPNQYRDGDLKFLTALAQVASLALANSRGFQAVERMATVDGLTGAFNRRFLEENLPLELARANRMGYPVSVLMLDVDNLKQNNNDYGHPTGDDILRQVVTTSRSVIRDTDWVARYGGDEFIMVVPGCHRDHLSSLCDKIQAAFAQSPVRTAGDEELRIRLSIGAAVGSGERLEAEQLIRTVDQAERSAKASGGNQCRIEPLPAASPQGSPDPSDVV